jgi:hypothetical protein
MWHFYFLGPLESLRTYWHAKLALSLVATGVASVLQEVLRAVGVLLDINVLFLLMAGTLFALDLIAGLYSVVRYEERQFSVLKLKRSGFKLVEWGLIIVAATVFANAAKEAGVPVLQNLHLGAIFWLALTDFFSMLVNIKGSETAAADFLEGAQAVATGQFTIDDLDSDATPPDTDEDA